MKRLWLLIQFRKYWLIKEKMKNKKIKLFEAFSWIWSQHQALKNLWFDVEIIGISDWYIDAIIAYAVNHLWIKWQKIDRKKTIEFLQNFSLSRDSKKALKSFWWISDEKLSILQQVINKFWKLDINHISWNYFIWKSTDLFTYSFPCQDISNQWKKAGFSKECKTRSWLLWEIERILKEIKQLDKNSLPKVLMMENVKAILNKEFKNDLDSWIKQLEDLWYKSTKPFIVNANEVWSAQKRQRVFMISTFEKEPNEFKLKWDYKQQFLWDIITNLEHEKLDLQNWKIKLIKKEYKNIYDKKWFLENYTSFNAENYFYYKDAFAPTITASWAQSRIKYLEDDGNIYFLNSLEHLLLQGFSKDFYNKLKELKFSETKIKFLAWNSINVKVLEEIFKFYL